MPVGILMCKDASGASVWKSMNARIKKVPDTERGKEAKGNQWDFICGNLEIFIGGTLGTYDPALYAFSYTPVGGPTIPISGFSEDSLVKVKRNEDNVKLTVGLLGEAAWSKQYNKSGEVTFDLLQTSGCNDLLSAAMLVDSIPGSL